MKIQHAVCLVSLLCLPLAGFAAAPVSCPYSPAEMASALGTKVEDGKVGFESDFGTGKSLDCRYKGKDMTLMVKQMVMKNPTQTQGWDRSLAGKKEAIANDPDGAMQQVDQGDMTSPNLHYARAGVIVELRVLGVGAKSANFSTLQKSLPKLRRLP